MRRSASKGLQNLANSLFVARHTAARPERDGLHFLPRALKIIVDDAKIIAAVAQHFLARSLETPLNIILGILPASTDAAFEIRPRRRQNEHGNGVGQFALHLQRSLDVN